MENFNHSLIRIAWFTPSLSETETLSEAFSNQVLPLLENNFEIKIYTDSFSNYKNYSTGHYLTAASDHQNHPYDLFVYQFENHVSSHFARAHAGIIPGLVIFHHINFLDYGAESFLNSPWTKILSQLSQSEIIWPSRKNKYLPQGPFGHRESAFALQALFSNPQNLSEYKRSVVSSGLSLQYQLEPQHLAFPIEIKSGLEVVNKLQLASLARPTIAERTPQFLKSLKNNPEWKLIWLIEKSEREIVESLVREFQVESQVELQFGRNIANWKRILSESSVALHLLFSVYDQVCPYLPISMSHGKIVITSDYGYVDYLPDNLIFKIPPGRGEVEILSTLLAELGQNRDQSINLNIINYARNHFSRELVVSELRQMIEENLSIYRQFYCDWRKLGFEAKASLIKEVAMVMNKNLTPFPDDFQWENILQPSFKELGWDLLGEVK